MNLKLKFILIISVIFLLNIIVGIGVMYENGQSNDLLRNGPTRIINIIDDTSHLNNLSQLIRYYDEVLTQSARNYAFTGDVKWKTRYDESAPKLDDAFKEVAKSGDEENKTIFKSIDSAKVALIDMETRAMNLVDQGRKTEAEAVLDSAKYTEQKAIYQAGLDKYYANQGIKSDSATTLSFDELRSIIDETVKANTSDGIYIGSLITLISLLSIIIYLMVYFYIIKPLYIFKKAAEDISKGDLNQKINIQTHDEIGDLATSFNRMTVDLRESKSNVEQKIAERTEELEKVNKFLTGRELRMIELKDKIKELENLNKKEK